MSELLRTEALILVRKVLDYITTVEGEGPYTPDAQELKRQIMRVADAAYTA